MYYFTNNDCVACRRCAELCPVGAASFDGDKFSIDKDKCTGCGVCAKACPASAIYPEGYVAPEPPKKRDEVITASCDLLVIGAGPAGLTAAAREAERGRKVIILESAKTPGGAGVHATGMSVFDTKWQKDAGCPEYMDDYIRSAMALTKQQLDYKLVANGFRANTAFFDWFCQWGEAENCFTLTDSPTGKSVQLKSGKVPAGRYVTGKLADRCKELGVEIRLSHRAKQLIMDGDKVQGVIADDPAGTTVISCRACLIATGNMVCADDLYKYLPEYAGAQRIRTAHNSPFATGDGVRMVSQAGIPVDGENICPHYLGAMPMWFDGHVLKQGLRGEGMRVNLDGKRFVSECVDRFDAVDQLLKQPGCVSFNVLDSNTLMTDVKPTIKLSVQGAMMLEMSLPTPGKRKEYINFLGMPVMLDKDGNVMKSPMDGIEEGRGMGNYPADSKPDIEKLKKYVSLPGSHVCVADTLEELALQMGVPAKNLVESVARYNEMCKVGRDEDFGKYPDYMLPIEKAPFIAIKCFLSSDGVFGGLIIDSDCNVKGDNGKVQGLYAAGDLTSGNYIKEHSHRTEIINDFAWANASGFLAGESIERFLKEDK